MATQLPRAPEDCGVVIYKVRQHRRRPKKQHRADAGAADAADAADDGADEDRVEVTKFERVRKAAVHAYLAFFQEYHKYFIEGLTARDGAVLVPPMNDIVDLAKVEQLPVNERGQLEGVPVRFVDDEVIDDDAGDCKPAADDGDDGDDHCCGGGSGGAETDSDSDGDADSDDEAQESTGR